MLIQADTLNIHAVKPRNFSFCQSIIGDNVSFVSFAYIYSTNAGAMVVTHLL